MQSWGRATLYPPRLDKPCGLGLERTGKTRVVGRGGKTLDRAPVGLAWPVSTDTSPGNLGGLQQNLAKGRDGSITQTGRRTVRALPLSHAILDLL